MRRSTGSQGDLPSHETDHPVPTRRFDLCPLADCALALVLVFTYSGILNSLTNMCTKSGAQQFFYAGGMGAVSVLCTAATAAIVRALICGMTKLVPRICDKIRQYRETRRDAKIRESVQSMQPTLQTMAMTAAAFEMSSGLGSPVHLETV